MEILVLIVIAVVWQVIKALTQTPPPQPRQQPAKRIIVSDPQPEQNFGPKPVSVPQYSFEDDQEVLEVEELDDLPGSDSLTMDEVLNGIIMVEVLGKPRAKSPHITAGRRN